MLSVRFLVVILKKTLTTTIPLTGDEDLSFSSYINFLCSSSSILNTKGKKNTQKKVFFILTTLEVVGVDSPELPLP